MISEVILQRAWLTIAYFRSTLSPAPRDSHGSLFPLHGQLAQGLNLTMTPNQDGTPPMEILTAVTIESRFQKSS